MTTPGISLLPKVMGGAYSVSAAKNGISHRSASASMESPNDRLQVSIVLSAAGFGVPPGCRSTSSRRAFLGTLPAWRI